MANFSYEVFSKVVERGTLAKAAAELNVTPSAVSHSVSQLETELGFPLLIRNRTGVALTEDGAQVLPIIQSIQNLEEQLTQVADNINGVNTGRIRIGAFSSVSTNWLPTIIRRFKKRYPHIEISVVQGTFNRIVEAVRLGTADIGFSSLPVGPGVVVEPLLKDPIYCITPKQFKPKNGRTVTQAMSISRTSFCSRLTMIEIPKMRWTATMCQAMQLIILLMTKAFCRWWNQVWGWAFCRN